MTLPVGIIVDDDYKYGIKFGFGVHTISFITREKERGTRFDVKIWYGCTLYFMIASISRKYI